jgi:hypothetical protein
LAYGRPVQCAGTHRFVPAKSGTGSVLESVPLPGSVLADLSELDAATNERKIVSEGWTGPHF